MSESASGALKLLRRPRVELYWILIAVWAVALAILFVAHLWTGTMPKPSPFSIVGLPVYWYGIIIVSGIALGAWIVSRLAWQRWREAFLTAVPDPLHALPLTDFPHQAKLARQHIDTLGDLLLLWGSDPRSLALTNDERGELDAFLAAHPAIDPVWLADAPWRKWTPDFVWNGIIICLVLGLIGARLYHVMTPFTQYGGAGHRVAR